MRLEPKVRKRRFTDERDTMGSINLSTCPSGYQAAAADADQAGREERMDEPDGGVDMRGLNFTEESRSGRWVMVWACTVGLDHCSFSSRCSIARTTKFCPLRWHGLQI